MKGYKGKIGIETAFAALFMVLIVVFVVWYGYLMVQIRTVGQNETGVAPTAAAAVGPSAPGAPPAAAGAPPAATARAGAPSATGAAGAESPEELGGAAGGGKRMGGGLGLGGKSAKDLGTE